jgi:hypothetical protein
VGLFKTWRERERGLSAELRSEERMFVLYAYVSERKCVIEMRKRMRMREEREKRERERESMKGSGMRVSESGLMEDEKDTERSMENKDITKREKLRE